jgi:hypothetical protein
MLVFFTTVRELLVVGKRKAPLPNCSSTNENFSLKGSPSGAILARVGATDANLQGFFISGTARMVHPFYPESYPAGSIYRKGRGSSIVQVGCFELLSFTVNVQELAEWLGLDLAMMVVDQCFTEQ